MGPLVGAGVVQLALAAALVLLGRWGVRNAGSLVQGGLPAEERAHRSHGIVVGARVCVAAGIALGLFAVVVTVAALAGHGPTLTPR